MNWKLLLNILSSINGGLITGAALLNPLFGQGPALKIISGLGLCQIIVSGISSNLSTQTNLVKDVLAMPGVEKITVNGSANQTLSAIAVDPTVNKIAPTQAAQTQVEATAKGT